MPCLTFISSSPIPLRPCRQLRLTVNTFCPPLKLKRRAKHVIAYQRHAVMQAKPERTGNGTDDSPSQPFSSLSSLSSLISAFAGTLESVKNGGENEGQPAAGDKDDSSAGRTVSLQSFVSTVSNALNSLSERQKGQGQPKDEITSDNKIRSIAITSFLVGLAGSGVKSKNDVDLADGQEDPMTSSHDGSPDEATNENELDFSISSLFATLGNRVGKEMNSESEVSTESGEMERETTELPNKANEILGDAAQKSREASEQMISSLRTALTSLLQKNLDPETEQDVKTEYFNGTDSNCIREIDQPQSYKPNLSPLSLPALVSALLARSARGKDKKDDESNSEVLDVSEIEWREEDMPEAVQRLQASKETSPMLLSFLSSVSSQIGDVTSSNLESIRQRLDGASDISQQAVLGTMRALGIEPLDIGDDDVEALPRLPLDPLLALILAGYSFRAYDEPAGSSYRETFAAVVQGSAISGLENQIIHTEFAYPDTSIISRRADGLFLLNVLGNMGLDGRFVTADINGAVVLDLLNVRHCSILRQRDPQELRERKLLRRDTDEVELFLYSSKQSYEEGRAPTHAASLLLAALVRQATDAGAKEDGENCNVVFKMISEDERKQDFFQLSLLPRELKLPFQKRAESQIDKTEQRPNVGGSIELQVSFIPFSSEAEDNLKKTGTFAALKEAVSDALVTTDGASKEAELQSILESELKPGQLPDPSDWTKLASVGRSLLDELESTLSINRTSTLRENIPGTLFLESLATDTEVWLFHDQPNKNLVISFRGTEQVSWRDFFTDAQLFLQRWAPGEDIDLNVDLSNTVGLADLIPSIFPNQESPIPENASAVHYGFLCAYLSVRDGLLRAINMLTDDLSEGYSVHFTGHSLGGALAIIASSDFQARHLYADHNVCCMSFGAPKVGNIHFTRLHNGLVPNSFRIVNDTDLVSRMPRSLAGNSPLSRYSHAGRTVLVNDQGEYWIEGSSEGSLEAMVSMFADPLRERYKNLQDLITFEQNLWNQLLSGRSVQNHMEDSYFVAMQNVLKKVKEDRMI